MRVEKINIRGIKPNPKNPRTIKDEKFWKLVESIKEFPKMMELRPIVVDENNVILGGNMRWKAAVEAGIKEVFVQKVENWSEEQKKEFLIKDNVYFGSWDYMLMKDFDALKEWGMELPEWANAGQITIQEDDDFFNDDDFSSSGTEDSFIGSKERERQNWEGAYMLMMFDEGDYNFIRKYEQNLMDWTATDNLSDAMKQILKKETKIYESRSK